MLVIKKCANETDLCARPGFKGKTKTEDRRDKNSTGDEKKKKNTPSPLMNDVWLPDGSENKIVMKKGKKTCQQ